jgi:integrase
MPRAAKHKMNLTARRVESLVAGSARREILDAAMPGLYLIIQPSGRKSWAVRFYHERRLRKLTIGTFPKIGLADARKLAQKGIRTSAEGTDPATAKKEANRAARAQKKADQSDDPKHKLTDRDLVTIAFERYRNQHIATLRPSTAREIVRLFEKRVLPKWKNRRLFEVKKSDVAAILDDMVASGAPVSANRALAAMRHFFKWIVAREALESSPCDGIKARTKEKPGEHALEDSELRWVWHAAGKIGWPFKQIVQLLILTGQRREEVAAMTEHELDGVKWHLPASRSKNNRAHTIHLSKLARSIIDDSPNVASKAGYLWTRNGERPPSDFSRSKVRLDKAVLAIARAEALHNFENPDAVRIKPWTFHDLRRTFATGLAKLKIRLEVTEATLNHKSGSRGGLVAIYNRHDYADEMIAAWDAWSAHVKKVCLGKSKPK